MNKLKKMFRIEYPLKKTDYVILALMAAGCFLLFQKLEIKALLSCVLYLACGIVIYNIGIEFGMGSKRAKVCAFAAVTMPVGFYCQFIFGSSRVVLLMLILLGFYCWLKNDDRLFLLFFAAAFLLDGQAFVLFITLLLLKQKEFWHVMARLALFLAPSLIKMFILIGLNEEYGEKLLDFTKVGIKGATIMLGTLTVNLTIIVAVLVMIYAYMKIRSDAVEEAKWGLYLVGLQLFAIFGLGGFEIQDIIIMIPFFTLSAFMSRDTKIFMALDIPLMLFFILYVVNMFPGIADETLIMNGILGSTIAKGMISKVQIKDLLILKNNEMVLSFFTVLVLVIAIFKHPKNYLEPVNEAPSKGTMGFVRARFICGMAIFLVPAMISCVAAKRAPYITLYTPESSGNIGYMITDRQQSEVFISAWGELESVDFCIGTYGRDNDVDVTVRIADATTDDILFEKVINVSGYSNYDWVHVDTESLRLTPGWTYRMDVVCLEEGLDENNTITLLRTEDLAGWTNGYAFVDGQRQEYHLCVKIIEDDLSSLEVK